MAFIDMVRSAFKGGAGGRAPLARTWVSPWSFALQPAPFEYGGAVRKAFLENPVAQRAVRIVAEGVGRSAGYRKLVTLGGAASGWVAARARRGMRAGARRACCGRCSERMAEMETLLRGALIDWLRGDAGLAGLLNAVEEEAPVRAAPPWLGIAASASVDWSTKDRRGREVRVALELHCRGDDPLAAAETVRAVEARVEAFPAAQDGFAVASAAFLRARAEQRAGNRRAVLLEYRFRVLEAV